MKIKEAAAWTASCRKPSADLALRAFVAPIPARHECRRLVLRGARSVACETPIEAVGVASALHVSFDLRLLLALLGVDRAVEHDESERERKWGCDFVHLSYSLFAL
ncbi:MAG: hypothetical protein WA021_00860 [Minisyncoccia bacterium]